MLIVASFSYTVMSATQHSSVSL